VLPVAGRDRHAAPESWAQARGRDTVFMVPCSLLRLEPPAPRFEARDRWTGCSKHVARRAGVLTDNPIPPVTMRMRASAHSLSIQT
jgi:hypothetical protein